MNAIELAEERANNPYLDPEANAEDFKKIATMLRQQQAEIEALKNAKRFIQNFAEEQHQRAVALEMRELTDEEIADFEWAIKNVLNFSQSEKVVGLDNVIRAILRKAQEK